MICSEKKKKKGPYAVIPKLLDYQEIIPVYLLLWFGGRLLDSCHEAGEFPFVELDGGRMQMYYPIFPHATENPVIVCSCAPPMCSQTSARIQ